MMVDIGNPGAPVGSEPWVIYLRTAADRELKRAEAAVKLLKLSLQSLKKNEHYKTLKDDKDVNFASWKEFVEYRPPFGLGVSEDIANSIMDGPFASLGFLLNAENS